MLYPAELWGLSGRRGSVVADGAEAVGVAMGTHVADGDVLDGVGNAVAICVSHRFLTGGETQAKLVESVAGADPAHQRLGSAHGGGFVFQDPMLGPAQPGLGGGAARLIDAGGHRSESPKKRRGGGSTARLVGARGFEPPTSSTQNWRADQTALRPGQPLGTTTHPREQGPLRENLLSVKRGVDHPVAAVDAEPGGDAGVHLEHCDHRLGRTDDGGGARRGIAMDVGNTAIARNEQHVEGQEGVAHPERRDILFTEQEQHAGIFGQGVAEHQPLMKLVLGFRDFDAEMEAGAAEGRHRDVRMAEGDGAGRIRPGRQGEGQEQQQDETDHRADTPGSGRRGGSAVKEVLPCRDHRLDGGARPG